MLARLAAVVCALTCALSAYVACPANCSGHGLCFDGVCRCDDGYFGPLCHRSACPSNCTSHGECVHGECACFDGYSGAACEAVICPEGCSWHGKCRPDGTCECEPGYAGTTCAHRTCAHLSQCHGNGQCVDGGRCQCDDGWSGEHCHLHLETDVCDTVSCGRHGRCHSEEGRPVCRCESGFAGDRCERSLGSGALLGGKILGSSTLHVAGGAALGLGVLGAVVMKRRAMIVAHDAAGLSAPLATEV